MPQLPYDTLPDLSSQLHALITQDWQHEVLSQLPPDYEQQARTLGAMVRQRGVQCAADLLRGQLAYVLCVSSLRHLGAWSLLIGLANVSHVAWHKRLQKSRPFLRWLLCQRLAVSAASPTPPATSRIVLIDATRLKKPGGTGDDYRAHLGYDLLAGRLLDVKLSDRHTAEGFTLFDLQAGDVVVADRGYSRRKQLAFARQRQAHVLVRLAVRQVPLVDESGAAFDVVTWLRERGSGQHSCIVSFESGGQRYHGRLLAASFPDEQASKARAKERKKAAKQQRQLKEETLYLCGWLLLWSSLPSESWSDEDLLALYRARWQIELVIKRLKSVLKLAQLRGKTAATNEAILLAVLLAWSLVQEEVQVAREQLTALCQTWATSAHGIPLGAASQPESKPQALPAVLSLPSVSSWSLTALSVQGLRQVVQGYWSPSRFCQCLPHLARFLCSRRCKREHQESSIRRRFLASAVFGQATSSCFRCSSA